MGVPVLSTYRLQLRGPASGAIFGFAEAEGLLDYLDGLGVSHLYLSPILSAVHGSEHGYDVVDPTTVATSLGGREGLVRLSAAARQRGMGLIVDIVPNHVGVAAPQQNPWWWDVLRHGEQSQYASFFDIDWELDPDRRIVLPLLGSEDDLAGLRVDGDTLRLWDLMLPIAPGTGNGDPRAVHDRQHYRLVDWRTGGCGYRRFFSITSLAALRQRTEEVFAASHAEIKSWFDEDLIDGLRVDHPDGLSDPAGYLDQLRALIGPDAYLVIEKVLAAGEALEPTLPVQGATGYDVLREIGGLFTDPAGRARLTELAAAAGFDDDDPAPTLIDLKSRAATEILAPELARLRRGVAAAAGRDHDLLPDAIVALAARIPVYRCDYAGLSEVLGIAIAETVSAHPELASALELVIAGLLHPDPAARFQQLCGAVTAKAVEDCLFYRDPRLVSLNEVGGEPDRFAVSTAEFHRASEVRSRLWPAAMSTLTTHDTKRGEDVRARIAVLSQAPDLWAAEVASFERLAPSPDLATGLFLWQNIFGVWPVDGVVTDELRQRLHGYAEKAIREAGMRTSWTDPDAEFEDALHSWLDAVLDGPAADGMTLLVNRLDPHARSDALGQKLLCLTVPGVPDVYQGTELWDDSLVDPDNRRPVDYQARRTALAEGAHPKLALVTAALQLRRRLSDTFLTGDYRPLLAEGARAEHLVAFARGLLPGAEPDVVVAVSRWTLTLAETGWENTVLALPPGRWRDVIGGGTWSGPVQAGRLFADSPVALLERADV
ncbi:malto-oligosyltrehalose synthase [Mycolicibacterium brumae]|uniref:Malto-oligosyltrehalose synthase n=1 Tax=Mycolicibacterium brumae TaxID=85968 RepID=A0A2G5P472_9MYCO|nr:malto-oligosyltrehalose synthase [Mycolicibacterium brumae]MCV7191266.1 malto-oligosyltrehalose synthase [Mycolicibacterium brumae]PIB73096.1 malto-oligosyltrehalose synthase [Mycolicibacterium brumae]RWA17027.1 hypothetical protein MBRU_18905 [Mycolicibacterium brumae DSM 44177]UWW08997.1 malto-oligosyltrehalose synthase [Mycolicibacterium brumae]